MAISDQSPGESGYLNPYLDSLIDGPDRVGTVTKTCGDTAGQTRTFAEQGALRTAFAILKAMTSTTFQYRQACAVNLAGYPAIWNDLRDEVALADLYLPGANQGGVGAVSRGRSNIKNPTGAQPVRGPSLREGFDVAIFVSKGL